MMNTRSHELNLVMEPRDVAGLLSFRGDPHLVLSFYMDADARQQELSGVRSRGHSLLHQAREELTRRRDTLEHSVYEAALDDLERCRAFLDTFLPGGACRGLALFSCTGRDWWQEFLLPRSVPDRSVWGAGPLVLPTLRLLPLHPRHDLTESEQAIEAAHRRERQDQLLQQMFDTWRSNGFGIVGVPGTLRALYLDEVQTLLIDAEFQRAGIRCSGCGALSADGDRCPLCGTTDPMVCPDLADEAIGDTLARGGQVELLEEPGELREYGGMGALLRFRPHQPPAPSPDTRSRIGER